MVWHHLVGVSSDFRFIQCIYYFSLHPLFLWSKTSLLFLFHHQGSVEAFLLGSLGAPGFL